MKLQLDYLQILSEYVVVNENCMIKSCKTIQFFSFAMIKSEDCESEIMSFANALNLNKSYAFDFFVSDLKKGKKHKLNCNRTAFYSLSPLNLMKSSTQTNERTCIKKRFSYLFCSNCSFTQYQVTEYVNALGKDLLCLVIYLQLFTSCIFLLHNCYPTYPQIRSFSAWKTFFHRSCIPWVQNNC